MGRQSTPVPCRRIVGRIVPGAAALIASAVVAAPALASGPTITVSGDSVLATSLPSFGQATIQATRPDALTGAPVVIGQFSGTANSFTPFSVNTTTPTPFNPAGDCWQKGAVSQALTPDLQPGDTVTLTQAGGFGGGATSASVTVQPSDASSNSGPISGCSGIAPWARNAITSGPTSTSGGDLTVSGVAQPLATGVSMSATDGTQSTTPVSATPASDGSWTATIPASDVARLPDGALTVTPVVTVPDVSTGAAANIAGVGLTVTKSASAPVPGSDQTGGRGTPAPGRSSTSTPAPGGTRRGTGRARVASLRVPSTVSLATAHRAGLSASFVVPAGVRIVRVELMHGKKRVFRTTVRSHRAGARQKVVLRGKQLSRVLRAGSYTIAVQAGSNSSSLGPVASRRVRIR
jgi:hypothetical protein